MASTSTARGRKRPAPPPPKQLVVAKQLRMGSDCTGYNSASLAAEALGLDYIDVFASDIDPKCRAVLEANFRGLTAENVWWDCMRRHPLITPVCDVYTAGFPCQSFSTEGLHRGEEDPRGRVIWSILEYIKQRKPRIFVLENVKALVDNHTMLFYRICRSIAAIKDLSGHRFYHMEWRVLNSREHGVPQSRQRVFIVGLRLPLSCPFRWPEPVAMPSLSSVLDPHKETPPALPSSNTALMNIARCLEEIEQDRQNGTNCKQYIGDLGCSQSRNALYRDIMPCLTKTRCAARAYYIFSRGRWHPQLRRSLSDPTVVYLI